MWFVTFFVLIYNVTRNRSLPTYVFCDCMICIRSLKIPIYSIALKCPLLKGGSLYKEKTRFIGLVQLVGYLCYHLHTLLTTHRVPLWYS
jgi:hypothetical protein